MRLALTKHVAIHAALPYNRDQMRGQTSFDAYHVFCGRKAQIVQRLVCIVVADQHFTKVGVQTGANVHVVPASA